MFKSLSPLAKLATGGVLLAVLIGGLVWLRSSRQPAIIQSCEHPRHMVQAGETLSVIAERYGVQPADIQRQNRLTGETITAGQVLEIPICDGGAARPLERDTAEGLIRDWIFTNQPGMNPTARFPLEEITPPGAWEQMQVQVFKTTGEVLQFQSYAISQGFVYPIGESFGGVGVHTLLVEDLEVDGVPELVYAYSFGSGIHQSSLGMLRRVEPPGSKAGGFETSTVEGLRYLGDLVLEQDDQGVMVHGNPNGKAERQTLGRLRVEQRRLLIGPIE